MVQGKEIETMQTVLYVEQIGDVWTWLIERCGGSAQDSRFMTAFSTRDNAEKAARIWAEMHGLTIDRIDFCRPPAWTKPVAQYPTEPGAPLTWQEAQKRVDAGLGVETLRAESLLWAGWQSTSTFIGGPAQYRDWTFRVPATAESPEVAITAELSRLTQELATTKTELAAARGLVKGLEIDRDNWHAEAKRLRGEKKALKLALGSFGL